MDKANKSETVLVYPPGDYKSDAEVILFVAHEILNKRNGIIPEKIT